MFRQVGDLFLLFPLQLLVVLHCVDRSTQQGIGFMQLIITAVPMFISSNESNHFFEYTIELQQQACHCRYWEHFGVPIGSGVCQMAKHNRLEVFDRLLNGRLP